VVARSKNRASCPTWRPNHRRFRHRARFRQRTVVTALNLDGDVQIVSYAEVRRRLNQHDENYHDRRNEDRNGYSNHNLPPRPHAETLLSDSFVSVLPQSDLDLSRRSRIRRAERSRHCELHAGAGSPSARPSHCAAARWCDSIRCAMRRNRPTGPCVTSLHQLVKGPSCG
jgi:hypothetical protein